MSFRNPVPTVDIIIEIEDESGEIGVVLIERANEPHGWALPGGFVDYGESLPDAAIREAKEETTLDVGLIELFHVYSSPDRDPRQHTISTVFIGQSTGIPQGEDDAERADIFSLDGLPENLAFDHQQILDDYRYYRANGVKRRKL